MIEYIKAFWDVAQFGLRAAFGTLESGVQIPPSRPGVIGQWIKIMISWINFIIMLISAFLFSYYYIKSVGPAALEKKIGNAAYPQMWKI